MVFSLSLRKRGIAFFTLIAISLILFFYFSYFYGKSFSSRHSIEDRISSTNKFVSSIENDMKRKVYITSYRIFLIYQKRIAEKGTYVNLSTFSELFFNGTINGQISDEERQLIEGVTFKEIVKSLNQSAKEINLVLDFSNFSVSVYQRDPWNVAVNFSSNVFINDLSGLSRWNITLNSYSLIPIHSFEDPLYVVGTYGKVPRKFLKTPYTFSSSNLTNLTLHLQGGYYINSSKAPSFLKRFEGDFSPDENGIESLVYLPDLSLQGIQVKEKSVVDYVYFSNSNPESVSINGMPYWFRIDYNSLSNYNLSV